MGRSVDELSIDEIRQRYLEKNELVSPRILARLQRDSRQGVRHLHAALKKRYERQREERLRLAAMRHFEQLLWKSGVHDIAGVDEAGMPIRRRRCNAQPIALGSAADSENAHRFRARTRHDGRQW